MRRYELTDTQWSAIAALFPERPAGLRGRPARSHRAMFEAILWVLFSGAPWRDLPERFGPYQTAYSRFVRWSADGTFDRALAELQWRADERGLLDWSVCGVDATSVRAAKAAAGAKKKPLPPGRP